MAFERFKNRNWSLPTTAEGKITEWDHVMIAVMMDVRDELQLLNAKLNTMDDRLGWNSGLQRELRGLRRDVKKLPRKITGKKS